jgi:hypothetical protein
MRRRAAPRWRWPRMHATCRATVRPGRHERTPQSILLARPPRTLQPPAPPHCRSSLAALVSCRCCVGSGGVRWRARRRRWPARHAAATSTDVPRRPASTLEGVWRMRRCVGQLSGILAGGQAGRQGGTMGGGGTGHAPAATSDTAPAAHQRNQAAAAVGEGQGVAGCVRGGSIEVCACVVRSAEGVKAGRTCGRRMPVVLPPSHGRAVYPVSHTPSEGDEEEGWVGCQKGWEAKGKG